MQPPSSAPLRVAGGVLWRPGDGGPDIALAAAGGGAAWSLPEAALEPGETEIEAARRALGGLAGRLGRFLGVARSRTAPEGGRLRLTAHWAFRAADGGPADGEDGLAWFPVGEAQELLGDGPGAQVLGRFREGPAEVGRVLLLRHCEAEQWREGEDALRPLTPVGRERAARLAGVVAAWGVDEAFSSPARRCVDTLAPAAARGLTPAEEPLFGERGTDRDKAAALLEERARAGEAVLVCTHAPLIGVLLERFASERPELLPRPARLDAGGAWCVEFGPGGPVGMSYLPPPPLPEGAP